MPVVLRLPRLLARLADAEAQQCSEHQVRVCVACRVAGMSLWHPPTSHCTALRRLAAVTGCAAGARERAAGSSSGC
jgi:hypothetical protein